LAEEKNPTEAAKNFNDIWAIPVAWAESLVAHAGGGCGVGIL